MAAILDYAVYNDRMRRSMWDKAFFVDKVPGTEVLIDYGCADGSLIRFLHGLFPTLRCIGFDIDPAMTAEAERQKTEGTWFFSRMEDVLAQLKALGAGPDQIAVNFSSVFHEVFHYGFDLGLLRRFLEAIGPRFVIVRDMMYASDDDAARISPEAEERVRALLPAEQLRDFEACWGGIGLRRNLVHLLLKYRYVENWERECSENYFSYDMERLMGVLDPRGAYGRIFFHRYVLPWCRHAALTDFGIDLGSRLTTHFSMILERRGVWPENTIAL